MNANSPTYLGWPLKGWLIVFAWVLVLLIVDISVVISNGTAESTLSWLARFHVRAAFTMFWLAFAAKPLATFFPSAFTNGLICHRPYLGVCFAAAHLGFLMMNITRVILNYDGEPFRLAALLNWLVGGSIYLVIIAMAITSFPTPRRLLGQKKWRVLHRWGSYLIALAYLNSFGLRAVTRPEYLPWAILVIALLALRLALVIKRHRDRILLALHDCCQRICGSGGHSS